MSNFRVLTFTDTMVKWPHNLQSGYSDGLMLCPKYVIYTWCTRRKRFRMSKPIAIGVPFDGWRRWGSGKGHDHFDNSDCLEFGKQLAAQNGIPWIKTFDPSWKLHDLMLMRLQGKI